MCSTKNTAAFRREEKDPSPLESNKVPVEPHTSFYQRPKDDCKRVNSKVNTATVNTTQIGI